MAANPRPAQQTRRLQVRVDRELKERLSDALIVLQEQEPAANESVLVRNLLRVALEMPASLALATELTMQMYGLLAKSEAHIVSTIREQVLSEASGTSGPAG